MAKPLSRDIRSSVLSSKNHRYRGAPAAITVTINERERAGHKAVPLIIVINSVVLFVLKIMRLRWGIPKYNDGFPETTVETYRSVQTTITPTVEDIFVCLLNFAHNFKRFGHKIQVEMGDYKGDAGVTGFLHGELGQQIEAGGSVVVGQLAGNNGSGW